MLDFDKSKLIEQLKNRKAPEKQPQTITVQGVKIKNVPVIVHKEGSLPFTIGFNTSSRIYELLSENKGKSEITYS